MLTTKDGQGFATCDHCNLRVQTHAVLTRRVWDVTRPLGWELVKLNKQEGQEFMDLCPACLFMITESKVCSDCETTAEKQERSARGRKILETIGRDMTPDEHAWLATQKG